MGNRIFLMANLFLSKSGTELLPLNNLGYSHSVHNIFHIYSPNELNMNEWMK